MNKFKGMVFVAILSLLFIYYTPIALAGGGAGAINVITRLALEKQLRQQIATVTVSIWNNENQYSTASSVDANGWAELKITNPAPGAYSMYISAQRLRGTTLFESHSEIIIREGENIVTPILSLATDLPVTLILPEDLNPENERIEFNSVMPDGGIVGNGWSTFPDNKRKVTVYLPIETVNLLVRFKEKEYTVSAPFLLGAMAKDSSLELIAFPVKNLTSISINASLRENYLIAGVDYKTIQATINAASSGQTVLIKRGFYNEQVTLKAEVPIIGDTTCPQCVVIESNEPQTIAANGPGNYAISGVSIRNTYSDTNGPKRWSTAAVLTDLGPHLKMDHCLIETTGTADPIAANYSALKFTNLTIKGSGSGVVGINLHNNNGPTDVFKNLLFYNLGSAMRQTNESIFGAIQVTNSLFWKASTENIKYDASNVEGDPRLYWDYPDINTPSIRAIMAIDGNYPGALRPVPAPQFN